MGRTKKPQEPDAKQGDMVVDGVLGDGFAEVVDVAGKAVAVRPQWTAEQVLARRPETARSALDLLAGGMPAIRVSRILGLSPHTVKALKDSGLSLAQRKERLGSVQLFASECAAEAVIEDMTDPEISKKIPTVQKAMISGIFSQRGGENLNGGVQVSVRVERVMTAEEWDAFVKGGAAMGSGARESAPKDEEKGADAPRVYEARESRPGEVIDLPADPAN